MSDQKLEQLRIEFRQKLSRLNDYLWGAGLKDPVTRIQQVSFMFFLKMLEEQDISMEKEERLTGHRHKSIFEGKNEKFRWSRWREKSGEDLYRFVRDQIFPFIDELHNGHSNIQQIFHGAKLLIPDAVTLKRTIEIVDTIEFSNLDTDIKGDLYESLLNQIEAAGELGQFLTPRHIVRAIVEMVNPKIGETIYDPACGSGGFLIAGYEYIRLKNSDPKNIEEENGHRRGFGDRLDKKQWIFLTKETFRGSDVDPEMVRLALMNLILHGIEGAHIQRKDTVAGSESEDDLKTFDIILTNPPFSGKVDRERIKPTLPVKSTKTQILFLGHVINSLKVNGKAGIILPDGTLTGTNRDHKEIRRYLLENSKIEAVVSIPAGAFQPYASVKTSFLIIKKKASSKVDESQKIWFFDMQGDGSSLSAAKKFGNQYRNDIPKLLELWRKGCAIEKQFAWLTPIKEIIENDFILSANTYNPYLNEEESKHRDPKLILKEINDINARISKLQKKLGEKL